jgi:hypothetical protein
MVCGCDDHCGVYQSSKERLNWITFDCDLMLNRPHYKHALSMNMSI